MATTLGYADLLLLIPGALTGMRAERTRSWLAFMIVAVVATVIAAVATVVPAVAPFIAGGSIAIAVIWRLRHR